MRESRVGRRADGDSTRLSDGWDGDGRAGIGGGGALMGRWKRRHESSEGERRGDACQRGRDALEWGGGCDAKHGGRAYPGRYLVHGH